MPDERESKFALAALFEIFEAGALSKDSAEGRVTVLLTGVEASAVESPLSQFQHTGIDRGEVFKLLQSINSLVQEPGRRTEAQLNRAFEKSWPDLEKQLTEASKLRSPTPAAPERDTDSIMKEMLELVRGLARDAEAAKLSTATLGGYFNQPNAYGTLSDLANVPLGNLFGSPPIPPRRKVGALSAVEGADSVEASGTTTTTKDRNISKAPPPIKPLKA